MLPYYVPNESRIIPLKDLRISPDTTTCQESAMIPHRSLRASYRVTELQPSFVPLDTGLATFFMVLNMQMAMGGTIGEELMAQRWDFDVHLENRIEM